MVVRLWKVKPLVPLARGLELFDMELELEWERAECGDSMIIGVIWRPEESRR